MNLILGTAVKLGQEATGILAYFTKRGLDRNDQLDLTLSALIAATRETQIYVARKIQDLPTEALLAKLWHTAAVAMRRFDSDLTDRLYLKGTYWTEPAAWTNDDVKNARITLDEMHEICRQLLIEK